MNYRYSWIALSLVAVFGCENQPVPESKTVAVDETTEPEQTNNTLLPETLPEGDAILEIPTEVEPSYDAQQNQFTVFWRENRDLRKNPDPLYNYKRVAKKRGAELVESSDDYDAMAGWTDTRQYKIGLLTYDLVQHRTPSGGTSTTITILNADAEKISVAFGSKYVAAFTACGHLNVERACADAGSVKALVTGGEFEVDPQHDAKTYFFSDDWRLTARITDVETNGAWVVGWPDARERQETWERLTVASPTSGTCTLGLPKLSDASSCPGMLSHEPEPDSTCRKVDACREVKCMRVDGECRPVGHGDCMDASICRTEGRCRLSGAECVATEQSCRESSICLRDGRCSIKGGKCVAANDDDCAKSRACRLHEQCDAIKGRCAATTKGCAASHACRNAGRCKADPKDGRCAATTRGCKQSERCARFGECKPEEKRCVSTRATCAAADVCKSIGYCDVANDRCVANVDGCRQSNICRTTGKCAYKSGECVPDAEGCRNSKFCKEQGICEFVRGSCRRPQ